MLLLFVMLLVVWPLCASHSTYRQWAPCALLNLQQINFSHDIFDGHFLAYSSRVYGVRQTQSIHSTLPPSQRYHFFLVLLFWFCLRHVRWLRLVSSLHCSLFEPYKSTGNFRCGTKWSEQKSIHKVYGVGVYVCVQLFHLFS